MIQNNSLKRSFTIFELMVVILIMGVVYYLAFAIFDKRSFEPKGSKQDFREKMLEARYGYDSVVKLICFRDGCYLEVDGILEDEIEFPSNAKMHFFTMDQRLLDKEFLESEVRYGKDVQFVYKLMPNAVFDSAVLEYEDNYIAYGPMLWNKYEESNFNDAKEMLFSNKYRLMSLSNE
ncbi:MAG: type II secretion system protein [Campylobacterales bacterium]